MSVPDLVTPVTRSCAQGSVPELYVNARSVEDVQKSVNFARGKNLRFVVKNSGHDYVGRSSGVGAFAVWYVVDISLLSKCLSDWFLL
jgi:FAD/FMN-containing dehydrogenase